MEPRPRVATDPKGSRGGGKQGSLVPGRWPRRGRRSNRRRIGAKGRGLSSRPPISTCTRATGLHTSSGSSQEYRRGCAGGVHPGSLGIPGHSRYTAAGQPRGQVPALRQLLSRLDARPLAARAAADVAALVRRAGATLRLRPKDAISELDSADIEVTDSRLPNPTFVEPGSRYQLVFLIKATCLETGNVCTLMSLLQHHRSEALGIHTTAPEVTQVKARCASKSPQASGQFSVELVRGSTGFGLTLSGGRDAGKEAPLAIRGLLKNGPAQRCGRLQAGDLVLHINGESTQGLTHAQVVERIRAGGPRLHLVLNRPLDTHPSKPEVGGGPPKGDDCSPDPGEAEVTRSPRASGSPHQHPQTCTMPKTRGCPEPSPEGAADGLAVPPPERPLRNANQFPGSPGPWLVPSEERLSRALGVPGATQLALETAAGRRRH